MVSLARRFLTNVFSSWAGFGLRLVIAFFFVPYITGVLGDARYGVWILIFQIVSYFFLFDSGMERALSRYLPRFLGMDDHTSLNRVLNSATALYAVVAVITMGATLAASQYLFPLFEIANPATAQEGRTALLIVGLFVALRFVFFPFGGSLGSFHRFDIAKGLEMAEEIGKTAVYVLLLSSGYGLVSLAVTMVTFSVARNLAGVFFLKRLHPEVRFDLSMIDRKTIRTLLRYSSTAFGVIAAWIVLFNSDSILLGLLASSAAIGIYAPGAQVMLYFRHIVNAIGIPLTPAVVHLESTRDMTVVREVYIKGLKYVSYLSFFLCVGIIAYAKEFVGLWLAPEFHQAYLVMSVLAVGSAVFLPQIVGNSILFAIDKHRYLLIVLLFEVAIKITLAAAFLKFNSLIEFDVTGGDATTKAILAMAVATVIPQFVLYLTLYPILLSRAVGVRLRRIWHTSLVSGSLAVIVSVFPAHIFRRVWPPDTWPTLALNVGLLVIIWAVVAYVIVLDGDDRVRLTSWLRIS